MKKKNMGEGYHALGESFLAEPLLLWREVGFGRHKGQLDAILPQDFDNVRAFHVHDEHLGCGLRDT